MTDRSSSRTSYGSTTGTALTTSRAWAPMSSARCCHGPCCGTAKTVSSDTATRPSFSDLACASIEVTTVNSTGRRNTLSMEVSDGQACGVDDDVDWAAGDALTGVPADSS